MSLSNLDVPVSRADVRPMPASAHRPGSLTREDVREFDRRAIADYALPGVVLMENAGRGAADLARRLWPDSGSVAVACGRGNNGGDGFVIARHLESHGRPVRVLLAAEPDAVTGDAATMLTSLRRADTPLVCLAAADAASWGAALGDATLVIDALLGTGASGVPRGAVAAAIAAIEAWRGATPAGRVLAVDVPSGLDCDTGLAAGGCVTADATATFVAAKRGFSNPAAAARTGAVHVLGIGAPRRLLAEFGLA